MREGCEGGRIAGDGKDARGSVSSLRIRADDDHAQDTEALLVQDEQEQIDGERAGGQAGDCTNVIFDGVLPGRARICSCMIAKQSGVGYNVKNAYTINKQHSLEEACVNTPRARRTSPLPLARLSVFTRDDIRQR